MQYSQKAFEEAFAAKEAVLGIETTIKKFINEQTLRNKTSEDEASDTSLGTKSTGKKIILVYRKCYSETLVVKYVYNDMFLIRISNFVNTNITI